MRRQRFAWTYMVIAILLSVYGLFFVIREANKNLKLFVPALIALIIGGVMLLVYLILYLVSAKKHKEIKVVETKVEDIKQEKVEEPTPVKKVNNQVYNAKPTSRVAYVNNSRYDSDYSYSSGYVSLLGRGPIIEVRGKNIRDMRDNRYYRIDSNRVYLEGSGVGYIIEGSRIKTINGDLLYEISGSNINKVFGGYFASISGNFIKKYDMSIELELSGTFSKDVILLIAVLVFGK